MEQHKVVRIPLVQRLRTLKRYGGMFSLLAAVALMMGCYGYPRHWGDRHRDGDRDHDHDDDHHGQVDSQKRHESAHHVFYP